MNTPLTADAAGAATEIPRLPAWILPRGREKWDIGAVWCRHCLKYHTHGVDPTADPELHGHRWAHCADGASPYEARGYVLVCAGGATKEILADVKWQAGGKRFTRRRAAAEHFAVDDTAHVVRIELDPFEPRRRRR